MGQPNGSALAILIVDDEANIRKMLSVCLETEGHRVTAVGNPEDALNEASRRSFDVAFVDLRLGVASGLDLIPSLLNTAPWLRIIVITAYASIDTAVEAVKRGATDYIPKPFTPAQIKLAVRKACDVRSLEQKVASLREDLGRSQLEADFSSDNPGHEARRQSGPRNGLLRCRQSCCEGRAARAKAFWPGPFTVGARGQTGPSASCLAHPCRLNCWKANCSATPRVPSPALSATIPAASAPVKEEPFFWTRSATCPWPSNQRS